MAQAPQPPGNNFVTFVGRRLTQLYEYDRVAIYGFLQNAATGQLRVHGVPEGREAHLRTLQGQILELCVNVDQNYLNESERRLRGKQARERDRRKGQKLTPAERTKRALFDAECSDWTAGRQIRAAGNRFIAGPDLTPNQHIRRERHPNSFEPGWDNLKDDEKSSKFVTIPVQWLEYPRPGGNNPPRRWRYFNPYDLLGLFLSVLGLAPPGANRERFYLPLTAVLARWCSQIGGTRAGGIGPLPYMLQCTWIPTPGQQDPFFLGASLGGYDCPDRKTGNWFRELRYARYEIVESFVDPVPDLGQQGGNPNEFNFDWTVKFMRFDPTRRQMAIINELVRVAVNQGVVARADMPAADRRALNTAFRTAIDEMRRVRDLREFFDRLQAASAEKNLQQLQTAMNKLWDDVEKAMKDVRFGNCAETYPFVNLLLPRMGENVRTSRGLALERSATWEYKYPANIHDGLKPPCGNCKELLRNLGFPDPNTFIAT
ncbi:hypothetical protein BDW42DRAFT_196490 [Aspergillus taichungensis]|uniref:Uncharacterized protein n=1 Tax=Aspergillus taichungensis TaxID=482145 RepID=A0A2J5HKC0_9EURO|nr:hypothetical protein BDW42DRAFT_196490 [Aspergillus taichungensis]